jgi:hypothetical protein
MPTILVMSNESTEQSSAATLAKQQGSTVTLVETVEPEALANDNQAAELVERVGWALTDAQDAEDASNRVAESGEGPAYIDPREVEEEVYENLYGRRLT